MKIGVLLTIMGIFSIFGASANSSPELDFWKWFQKNNEMLFHFEKDTERTFDKLSAALSKVNSDLTFEFGPIESNGKREFVISAGGIKNSFPSVKTLFNSAPDLDKWTFIQFRQRREPLNDLSYGGVTIKPDDVNYKLYKDKDKLGVILFFSDYNEKEQSTFGNIGYLFLDEALGEYDVETKLGFIEFHNKNSEQFENSKEIKYLAEHFDESFEN